MICSNFGRKSDRIVRNKESLARIWLFRKFKVKVTRPKRPRTKQERNNWWDDPCHLLRRHGPQNPLYVIKDRILQTTGDALSRRIEEGNASSRFDSMGKLWEARELFLMQHEKEMEQFAADLNKDPAKDPTFTRTMVLPNPVGEGYVLRKDGTLDYVGSIKAVTFSLEYEDGTWYEVTGYPNARDPFGEKAARNRKK